MSRILTIRKPRQAEAQQLQEILETSEHPGVRRRAEAVLLYGAGANATEIAAAMAVHPNTIYADLQAFARQGVAGVRTLGVVGPPPKLTAVQQATIRRVAEQSPVELGLPWGRWSLAKLRAYLLAHRLLPGISREHLRRVLQKGGCGGGGSGKNWSAPTPAGGRFWPESAGFGAICHPEGCCCSSM